MIKVKVLNRQTIYDVCIQQYGSLDFLVNLVVDNSLLASKDIQPGDYLLIDETIGEASIKDELSLKYIHNDYFVRSDLITLSRADITLADDTITLSTLYK